MEPIYFWLTAFVVFGVVEAATVNLTSIWFALGALAALVAAALGAQLWLQAVLLWPDSILAAEKAEKPVKQASSSHCLWRCFPLRLCWACI